MTNLGYFPTTRLRRLRQNPQLRQLIRNTHLLPQKLVLPLFIRYGNNSKKAISSMPGHYQFSIDLLPAEIEQLTDLGIHNIILFGIPEKKDSQGSDAYSANGVMQTAIATIKKINPNLLIFSDICCCEYTDHGHCGVVTHETQIDNDQTLDLLAKQAVSHAKAGTDVIAPSACMDGMVTAIRQALDANQFSTVPILSYAVKYASSLYSPFRHAAEGAPQFGDRQSYQMDFANKHEALRECALDIAEGADMIMVKPAHTYLDIIYQVKQAYPTLPLAAYHTSGEFALLKAAAQQGWLDEAKSVIEVLTAIHRAGADFIFTYYAKEVVTWLKQF